MLELAIVSAILHVGCTISFGQSQSDDMAVLAGVTMLGAVIFGILGIV